MERARRRRSGALLAGAARLATVTMAAPTTAKEDYMCLGREATIVGTNASETILGTKNADVIVALGGNDIVIGRGGADVICGGPGKDRLVGNGGADRLYGNAGPDRLVGGLGPDRMFGGVGNDVLVGKAGDDLLDGGPGSDYCLQGQGTGPEVRCELSAPLGVTPTDPTPPTTAPVGPQGPVGPTGPKGPQGPPGEVPARTGDTGGGQDHANMQPFVTLNCIIALQGIFPSRNIAPASVDPFIGEVTWFAGNFAPRGWAFCDGQLLSIAENTALFSILGTTYGGDGRTTFGLPDARGRAIVHEGQGPGLTSRRLGERAGQERVTLTVPTMPSHDHPIPQ